VREGSEGLQRMQWK